MLRLLLFLAICHSGREFANNAEISVKFYYTREYLILEKGGGGGPFCAGHRRRPCQSSSSSGSSRSTRPAESVSVASSERYFEECALAFVNIEIVKPEKVTKMILRPIVRSILF